MAYHGGDMSIFNYQIFSVAYHGGEMSIFIYQIFSVAYHGKTITYDDWEAGLASSCADGIGCRRLPLFSASVSDPGFQTAICIKL